MASCKFYKRMRTQSGQSVVAAGRGNVAAAVAADLSHQPQLLQEQKFVIQRPPLSPPELVENLSCCNGLFTVMSPDSAHSID